MSLRHALLAMLTAKPMTGYDMVKYFDGSVAYIWSAPHSQIYPELRRMEQSGLLDAEVTPRGPKGEKRVYSINAAGLEELTSWLAEPTTYQLDRDPFRVKVAHFEFTSYETARAQLRGHRDHFRQARRVWERMINDIDDRRVPLLQQRLERRPAHEHEAIVAFKRLAFRGQALQAQTEIDWAEEGLTVLDKLQEMDEIQESASVVHSGEVEPQPR